MTSRRCSSQHAFAESLVSVKKGWYTVIKCNSQRIIWAISVDCASLKTYNGYDYYATSLSFISQSKIINRLMEVKEFDIDVDMADDEFDIDVDMADDDDSAIDDSALDDDIA